MCEHRLSRPGVARHPAWAAGSRDPAPVARQSGRTAEELAAAIEAPVTQAESMLLDFAARGVVAPVDGRFALTEYGRQIALAFVAAGEEGVSDGTH